MECQQHEDYQAAIRWLLGALEEYNGHAQTVAAKGTETRGALSEDSSLNTALNELKTLLERFANGKSLDEVQKRADTVYTDAREDEELRNWFKRLDAFARRVRNAASISCHIIMLITIAGTPRTRLGSPRGM